MFIVIVSIIGSDIRNNYFIFDFKMIDSRINFFDDINVFMI